MMHNTNRMFIVSEMKIADVISGNPYLLMMLEHLEIDLEVRDKTIDQICKENKINTDLFLTIAGLFNGIKSTAVAEYTTGNIHTIISYLEKSHRYYINEKYPQIRDYIEEINKKNNHAEILMLGKFFDKYFKEVTEHLDYENEVVFPYVLNLDNQLSRKNTETKINTYSVTEYREHHDDIEEKLNDLKNLLIKYMPMKDDRQIRRKLLLCLFELESDLNIHSRIEESILIPLVEKMELLAGKKK
jgi:regulator of cell morphogenesis and NO signaling